MRKGRLILFVAIQLRVAIPAGVLANQPAPPVDQRLGMKDGIYDDLAEADCRLCHGQPSSGHLGLIADRHHNLVGTPIKNPSAAPFGVAGEPFGCLSCHRLVKDPEAMSFVLTPFRDCLFCHTPQVGTTVHHLTAAALGKDCQHCHGSLVDNPDDGHYIPTYEPTEVIPWPSGKPDGGPNGEGNCDYCHSTSPAGTPGPVADAAGVKIYLNRETHHRVRLGCNFCHSAHGFHGPRIRQCEACHGVSSLHSIQFDDGNGVDPGHEPPFQGHIGSNRDCFGCHGYGSPRGTPRRAPSLLGPIVARIDGLSDRDFVAGTPAGLTLRGSGFVDVGNDPAAGMAGGELRATVLLRGEGERAIPLVPAQVASDRLVVALPADLPPGNYRVTALKGDRGSNPVAISIRRAVQIHAVSWREGQVTVLGAGFGGYVQAANLDIGLWVEGERAGAGRGAEGCTILRWEDAEILAACPHAGALTVRSLFGTGRQPGM